MNVRYVLHLLLLGFIEAIALENLSLSLKSLSQQLDVLSGAIVPLKKTIVPVAKKEMDGYFAQYGQKFIDTINALPREDDCKELGGSKLEIDRETEEQWRTYLT